MYSSISNEADWKEDWGGDVYFSHGETNSKGVAILIPSNLQYSCNNIIADDKGRLVVLDITVKEQNLVIANTYAPTKDKASEQLEFFEYFSTVIAEFQGKNIIIGGDFNTYLDPSKDKKGGKVFETSHYTENLKTLADEINLIDIFRVMHPNKQQFTWRGKSKSGIVQSRLDYFFISTHILYDVVNISIAPAIKSDHSILSLDINMENNTVRGRGFWKFNSKLLHNIEYAQLVKRTITECNNTFGDMENKALLWDAIKCQLRSVTISFASWLSKETQSKVNELKMKLKELEFKMSDSEASFDNYQRVKMQYDGLIEETAQGALIRSRAKYIEQNEKCTKLFLNLEKQNAKVKNIRTLIIGQETITDPKRILAEERSYFSKLYTKDKNNDCAEQCSLFNCNITKLSDQSKDKCDHDISEQECTEALRKMPNNKAPGTDGFTTEFYKFFWQDIKKLVFQSFMHSYNSESLSIEQRRALLTLLPKPDKDLRYLTNWRPLSLLNTDYKILTKVLSSRLQSVIKPLVNEDQVGFLKGRQISTNCRKILDIFESTSLKANPGFAMFLDFQKAFDSVSWNFLFNTLTAFNFGKNFIKWVKIVYNNPECIVMNNGHAAQSFKPSRGIRQGCPLSSLLFILVAEILANNIRQDKNIKPLRVKNVDFVITQMADDTTLFVSDINSVHRCVQLLEHFKKCAGLAINKDKTKVFQLGTSSLITENKFGLRWTKDDVKVTGIYVGKNLNSLNREMIETKIQKMKTLTNMWKGRKLTIKGKITLIRCQMLPNLLYLASCLYFSDDQVKSIDKVFFEFLWPNKKHHVKKNVIIQEIERGGLRMPDIESMIKSIKIMSLKRLCSGSSKYTEFVTQLLNLGNLKKHMIYKYDKNFLDEQIPFYYRQLLECWYELHSTPPKNTDEILEEHLYNNKFILVGGEPVKPDVGPHVNKLKRIKDLVDKDGNFINATELKNKNNVTIDIMLHNSIKSAIPRHWIDAIKRENSNLQLTGDDRSSENEIISINIEGKNVSYENLTCKQIYKEFVCRKYERATALYKWEETYFYYNFDWKDLYRFPYVISRDTTLQSFYYQLLNRYLPYNCNLNNWGITETNICSFCDNIDTIEHYLLECADAKIFWSRIEEMIYDIYQTNIKLSYVEKLLGIENKSDNELLYIYNYCLLLGKYYIYKKKTNEQRINFTEFLNILKERLQIEKYILSTKGEDEKFNKWVPLNTYLSIR